MSQSASDTHYGWDAQYHRYRKYSWNYYTSQWEFAEWMPVGWTYVQEQRSRAQSQTSPGRPADHTGYASHAVALQQPTYASPVAASQPTYASYGVATQQPSYATSSSTVNQFTTYQGFATYQSWNAFGATPAASASQPNPHYRSPTAPPSIRPLPRGRGQLIQGTYNAQLGTKEGNLHYESIDPSYFVRDRKFFREGRVFSVLFSDTGSGATDYNTSMSMVDYRNHNLRRSSRRFVVVRVRREFCYACPIFTYSGRATTKAGVRPAEHGVVYSAGEKQRLLPGEGGIIKIPIAVVRAHGEPSLPVASRIYYGVHHPIQYNIKVKDIGQVLPDHVPYLIGNWKAEDEGETRQAAEVTAEAENADPEEDYDDDDNGEEQEDEEEEDEEDDENEWDRYDRSKVPSTSSYQYYMR